MRAMQLRELERLGEVVVGPGVEARDLVLGGRPGGEHEDVGGDPGGAPALQERQPVHLREHDVEDDHVVGRGPALHVPLLAVGRDIDREPFLLQPLPDGPDDRGAVLDEQYAHFWTPIV